MLEIMSEGDKFSHECVAAALPTRYRMVRQLTFSRSNHDYPKAARLLWPFCGISYIPKS